MRNVSISQKSRYDVNASGNEASSFSSININYSKACIEAVNLLNTLTGSNFSPKAKIAQSLLEKLLNRGYRLSEIKKVIRYKVNEWSRVKSMRKYLRPQTLFDIGNFKEYHSKANAKT